MTGGIKAGKPFIHKGYIASMYADSPAAAKFMLSVACFVAYLACCYCRMTGVSRHGVIRFLGYTAAVNACAGPGTGQQFRMGDDADDKARCYSSRAMLELISLSEEQKEQGKDASGDTGFNGRSPLFKHLEYIDPKTFHVVPFVHAFILGVVKDFLKAILAPFPSNKQGPKALAGADLTRLRKRKRSVSGSGGEADAAGAASAEDDRPLDTGAPIATRRSTRQKQAAATNSSRARYAAVAQDQGQARSKSAPASSRRRAQQQATAAATSSRSRSAAVAPGHGKFKSRSAPGSSQRKAQQQQAAAAAVARAANNSRGRSTAAAQGQRQVRGRSAPASNQRREQQQQEAAEEAHDSRSRSVAAETAAALDDAALPAEKLIPQKQRNIMKQRASGWSVGLHPQKNRPFRDLITYKNSYNIEELTSGLLGLFVPLLLPASDQDGQELQMIPDQYVREGYGCLVQVAKFHLTEQSFDSWEEVNEAADAAHKQLLRYAQLAEMVRAAEQMQDKK